MKPVKWFVRWVTGDSWVGICGLGKDDARLGTGVLGWLYLVEHEQAVHAIPISCCSK